MKWALALLLLAGCVAPTAPNPEPEQHWDLAPVACEGILYSYLLPETDAKRWIPARYQPGEPILSPSPLLGESQLGLVALKCEGNPPRNQLTFFVAVEPPTVAGRTFAPDAVHLYDVGTFFEHLPEVPAFQAAGSDISNMTTDFVLTGPADDNSRDFLARDPSDQSLIINVLMFTYGPATPWSHPIHIWEETPNGTMEFEGHMSLAFVAGPTACASQKNWVDLFLYNCALDRVLFGGNLENVQMTGTYRFHPERFAS